MWRFQCQNGNKKSTTITQLKFLDEFEVKFSLRKNRDLYLFVYRIYRIFDKRRFTLAWDNVPSLWYSKIEVTTITISILPSRRSQSHFNMSAGPLWTLRYTHRHDNPHLFIPVESFLVQDVSRRGPYAGLPSPKASWCRLAFSLRSAMLLFFERAAAAASDAARLSGWGGWPADVTGGGGGGGGRQKRPPAAA